MIQNRVLISAGLLLAPEQLMSSTRLMAVQR